MVRTARSYLGFTLVELMVVIAIVAILTIIAAVVFRNVTNQAKVAKVQSDLKAISDNIQLARFKHDDVLGHITGNWCSECAHCRPNGSQDPQCMQDMKTSYATVTSAPMPLDPWGGTYVFDENESESGLTYCCVAPPFSTSVNDFIHSAGPDHIFYSPDDVYFTVPSFFCTPNQIASYPDPSPLPWTNGCFCTSGPTCAP